MTEITTAIATVTVYPQQARIERRGQIQLDGQERELTIANLPLSLVPDSLRVAGRGDVAVKLLAVRAEHQYASQSFAPKIVDLEEQIQTLEQRKRSLQDQGHSAQLQQAFVRDLSNHLVEDLSRSLARRTSSLEEMTAVMSFLGDRHTHNADAIAALERQHQDCDRQLKALQQQLRSLQQQRPTESYIVTVSIEPGGAGTFELSLAYMVHGAHWNPLYDLEVNSSEGLLDLTYLAEVTQTTGEDWSGVALTLSTAKPSLGTLPPRLDPWYLEVAAPVVPIAMSAPAMGGMQRARLETAKAEGAIADEMAYADLAEPFMEVAQTAVANVEQVGNVVSFAVGGGSDIPADGNPHQVTLVRDRYPAQWTHMAIPKRVSFAYLQAAVQNPEDGVTLLPGRANLFRDGAFVGGSDLGHIAPGQRFEVSLGIDESVQIERELVERAVSKKLIGGQRQITYAYRVKLTNLQIQRVMLKLTEQLPTSRHEKVKVRLTQVSPRIEPGEMGRLDWNLVLESRSPQVVSYQFVVEYPPELQVIGLGD